jgi:hypothetical protein
VPRTLQNRIEEPPGNNSLICIAHLTQQPSADETPPSQARNHVGESHVHTRRDRRNISVTSAASTASATEEMNDHGGGRVNPRVNESSEAFSESTISIVSSLVSPVIMQQCKRLRIVFESHSPIGTARSVLGVDDDFLRAEAGRSKRPTALPLTDGLRSLSTISDEAESISSRSFRVPIPSVHLQTLAWTSPGSVTSFSAAPPMPAAASSAATSSSASVATTTHPQTRMSLFQAQPSSKGLNMGTPLSARLSLPSFGDMTSPPSAGHSIFEERAFDLSKDRGSFSRREHYEQRAGSPAQADENLAPRNDKEQMLEHIVARACHILKVEIDAPSISFLKIAVPFVKALVRDLIGPPVESLFGNVHDTTYECHVLCRDVSIRFPTLMCNVVTDSPDEDSLVFSSQELALDFDMHSDSPSVVYNLRSTPGLTVTSQLPAWHTYSLARPDLPAGQLYWDSFRANFTTCFHDQQDVQDR